MAASLDIIGVPIDLGQSHRGVDLGPGALRYAGLAPRLQQLGHRLRDRGNLSVPVRDMLAEQRPRHYLPAVTEVCRALYQAARESAAAGHLPIFLGGDHSLAIGSIGGISHDQPAAVLWIDAHGDFNTPSSSPSGNIHGMALATLLGQGHAELVDLGRPGPKLQPRDVVLIGVRTLDGEERRRLAGSGIRVYTMRDLDERGMSAVIGEALQRLDHHPRLHVSLDVDALDPLTGPGVGTPAPGGLTYREAQLLMEVLADSGRVCSLDLVEINPILDHRNQTAQIAVDLAVSLFGQRIL